MFEYMKLEIRRVLRDRRYLIFSIGFPLGFYLMYTRAVSATDTVDHMPWATFYMVSMATFGAIGAALQSGGTRVATERANGWIKQLRATPLPPRGYLVAKGGAAMAVAFPSVFLIALAGRLFNHVSLSAASWVEMVGLVWLCALPFAVLGVLLGYLFTVDSAQAGTTLTLFALAIFGGMWWPFQLMPRAMRYIGEATPSYHFANIGWRIVSGDAPRVSDLAVVALYAIVLGAITMWKYRSDSSWRSA
ncbi:MAG TPA: ABC transporter permease [Nitrolancea sp.]|jgi:ABC-2 type transport system permease protein|nr:ABC transporter permease [Nitrolancea sp.]